MRKNIIILTAALLIPMAAGAQALRTSYFLDNSVSRIRLNPAFSPRANYFSLPVLGNTGVGLYGNIGVSDFCYPMNGELCLYLNKNISVDQFLSKLPQYPSLDINTDIDILNFGFYTSKNSFWSFETGLKVDASVGISRDFLEFTKRGTGVGKAYSLKGFNVYADAALYAAIGHSRDLSDHVKGLRVGAKLKLLVPVAHLGLDLGNSVLDLSGDKWEVSTDATGTIASSFMRVTPPQQAGEAPGMEFDYTAIKPAGYGFGIDLGAEYRLSVGSVVDGLTFSFSALDLGACFYKAENVQKLASKGNAVYGGFEDVKFGEDINFEQWGEDLKNEFLALANFEEVASEGMTTITNTSSFNFGVEYPFLRDKMSVGLLYTLKMKYSKALFNELTVSYNLNPCKWFHLGISWSFLNSYQ
ncbi:MAG: DUF5723 family protein, partial [Candidatus Cryptobacteroides sp.]